MISGSVSACGGYDTAFWWTAGIFAAGAVIGGGAPSGDLPTRSDTQGGLARRSAGGLNHWHQVMPAHLTVPQPGPKPASRPLEEARCEHCNTTSTDAPARTQ
jgi:hypothetical protein